MYSVLRACSQVEYAYPPQRYSYLCLRPRLRGTNHLIVRLSDPHSVQPYNDTIRMGWFHPMLDPSLADLQLEYFLLNSSIIGSKCKIDKSFVLYCTIRMNRGLIGPMAYPIAV